MSMLSQAERQEALPEATPPVSILPHAGVICLSIDPHPWCLPALYARTMRGLPAGWDHAGLEKRVQGKREKQAVLRGRGKARRVRVAFLEGLGFDDDRYGNERKELAFPLCSTGYDFRTQFPHLYNGLVTTLQLPGLF